MNATFYEGCKAAPATHGHSLTSHMGYSGFTKTSEGFRAKSMLLKNYVFMNSKMRNNSCLGIHLSGQHNQRKVCAVKFFHDTEKVILPEKETVAISISICSFSYNFAHNFLLTCN